MKKTLLFLGIFLTFAFLYAQNHGGWQQKSALILQNQDVESEFYSEFSQSSSFLECPTPRNLTVDYGDDCQALIEWRDPRIVLWDNTLGTTTNSGFPTALYLLSLFPHYNIMADDFIIPAGETWTITEVYCGGFYQTASGNFTKPDFIGIEIYEDNGGDLPGTRIYEQHFLTLSGGMQSKSYAVLPEPFEIIAPGKYWIAVFGVYEDIEKWDESRYYVYTIEEEKEAPICFWSEEDGPDAWDARPGYSMYFSIIGNNGATMSYNLYRDGEIIQEKIQGNSYIDTDFNPSISHYWTVKTVCEDGTESNPVNASKKACVVSVNELETSFTILPNPANDKIKVSSTTPYHTLEIVNFLGQTVITLSENTTNSEIDISNLSNGLYFVRISTNNGTVVNKFIKQ